MQHLQETTGIITKAIKASFYTEMQEINEQKDLSKIINFMYVGNVEEVNSGFLDRNVTVDELKKFSNTLKAEIVFARNAFGTNTYTGKGDMLTTKQIWKNNLYDCQTLFNDETWIEGVASEFYYISKEASGKEEKYIYDRSSDICFKIPDTRIGSNVYHSLEYAKFYMDGENSTGVGVIDTETGIMTSSSGVKSYEPDLNNFSYKTEIVYYSADFKQEKTLSVKEFLEQGKPSTMIADGATYTFANYTEKTSDSTTVWANIKCTSNGLESYWVWIPRYAYKLNASENTSDIIFVNTDNKQIDGTDLPEGYVVHEAFTQKEGLKGIWFSKYNPTALESLAIDNTEPEMPDLRKFNANDTKLIYYTEDAKESIEVDYTETPNQSIERDGKTYYFYKYESKIWANVKCTANGLESYWVWIPRYAYKLESGESSVILVDTNNRPIDTEKYGTTLPESYTVHEAFTQQPNLKGIWFSKYNPTATETGLKDNGEPQAPDLSNFSASDTKLIYYTEDAKSSIEVDFTTTPSQSIEKDGKTYYFYKYESKIWANIKTTANGLESYWTWIPRYAYKLESGTTNVILVDENNRPLNTSVYGNSLPEGYTVHEAFSQGDGLKGIWFSKYNPSKVE